MMTPETNPTRAETLAEMQRLLSQARPDQIRRLMQDIMVEERTISERRAS